MIARLFDRTTGLIASAILAALPVAIVFSRIGFDASQTPLFSLIAVYFAFRGRPGWTLLAFLACLLIHPTNVFLAPVLLAVLAVRALERTAGNPRARLRSLGLLAIVPTLGVLAFGLFTLRKRMVQATYATPFEGLDWPRFGTRLGRLFFALGQFPTGDSTLALHDWAFRLTLLVSLAIGLRGVWKSRQYDVLAMLGGLVAGLVAFHIVAGRDAIRLEWVSYLRYGLFAVIPAVIALACLLRTSLADPQTWRGSWIRGAQATVLLALGWAMLLSVKTQWFDRFTATGTESIWTFRTDAKDPNRQVVWILSRDALDHPPGKIRVFAQDQWLQRPVRYLAGPRTDLEVVNIEEHAATIDQIRDYLRDPLSLRRLRRRDPGRQGRGRGDRLGPAPSLGGDDQRIALSRRPETSRSPEDRREHRRFRPDSLEDPAR